MTTSPKPRLFSDLLRLAPLLAVAVYAASLSLGAAAMFLAVFGAR